jgi:hypothetical protein
MRVAVAAPSRRIKNVEATSPWQSGVGHVSKPPTCQRYASFCGACCACASTGYVFHLTPHLTDDVLAVREMHGVHGGGDLGACFV